MKAFYIAPDGPSKFKVGEPSDHCWFIDVDNQEYLELVKWLKGIKWQGVVAWYPHYFPGAALCDTKLQMQITASDDRDATLIKLSL